MNKYTLKNITAGKKLRVLTITRNGRFDYELILWIILYLLLAPSPLVKQLMKST